MTGPRRPKPGFVRWGKISGISIDFWAKDVTDAWFDASGPAPDSAGFYVRRGDAQLTDQEYHRAISDYTEAIALNPENAAAYVGRGSALDSQGFYGGAISDYTRAIELDADNVTAYERRGMAHFIGKQQYGEAIMDFTAAIAIRPNDATIYYWRGWACFFSQQYGQALEDYAKAIQLKPDYAEAYCRRAELYLIGLRDYDKAWADVKECRKQGGEPPDALISMLTKTSGRSE